MCSQGANPPPLGGAVDKAKSPAAALEQQLPPKFNTFEATAPFLPVFNPSRSSCSSEQLVLKIYKLAVQFSPINKCIRWTTRRHLHAVQNIVLQTKIDKL